MAALRAAPKRCGKHTIPEPFRMRNMASLGVAVEGRKGRTQTLARLATPCSVWRNADVETAGNGAVFVGCSCEIPRGGSLSTRCLGGNGWQQPNRPGSSAAQWASRANRGSGSVAGCRRRGLRSRSSRVRIEWRTAETVSLSCVDGLAKTWRAWKARSGRGQGVVVAGWSGRWIEYPTLSRILDPGHSKRVLESRVSCPSTKVQGCEKKEKTVPSWTLPRQESRPAPSRKEDGQCGLSGLGAGTCKSGVAIKWQFFKYPYRWVVARRSSIPLRLSPVPVSQSPASQLPSTMYSSDQ